MAAQASESPRHRRTPAVVGVWLLCLAFSAFARPQFAEPAAEGADAEVWLFTVHDAIGPATADYLVRGIGQAGQNGAALAVIVLDTPGGLDTAMRDIIQAILSSPIPIATYVSPSGARAASAGTYIMYASHIAAMAPATNLGAATPVQIGVPGLPSLPSEEPGDGQDAEPVQPATAMERKILNDAEAYIRGLAELRGRNIDWAMAAVREGVSLSAEQALEMGVIDYLAADLDDLLRQVDGREIDVLSGAVTLAVDRALVRDMQPDWRNRFLAMITNPNVAYILLLIGFYGLLFEFYNPGLGGPGIIGAICLLLALYALQVLPVSYFGLALLIGGIALMVAEALSPSFGILGIGGVIAFVIGSIALMDTELPAYRIALPVILALAAVSAGFMIMILGLVVRATRQKVVSGLSVLLNQTGFVEMIQGGEAKVRLQGELWQVKCDQPLSAGNRVRVSNADSVVLDVEKIGEGDD